MEIEEWDEAKVLLKNGDTRLSVKELGKMKTVFSTIGRCLCFWKRRSYILCLDVSCI